MRDFARGENIIVTRGKYKNAKGTFQSVHKDIENMAWVEINIAPVWQASPKLLKVLVGIFTIKPISKTQKA
jgi:hypothetical protein